MKAVAPIGELHYRWAGITAISGIAGVFSYIAVLAASHSDTYVVALAFLFAFGITVSSIALYRVLGGTTGPHWRSSQQWQMSSLRLSCSPCEWFRCQSMRLCSHPKSTSKGSGGVWTLPGTSISERAQYSLDWLWSGDGALAPGWACLGC